MGIDVKTPLSAEETEKFYTYGFCQYESGNYKEAVDVFRILCTNHPTVSRFWFALGASLQQTHLFEEALRAWAVAAILTPQDPMPHFHAAECYLSTKNLIEANKALDATKSRMAGEDPLNCKIDLLKKQWGMS